MASKNKPKSLKKVKASKPSSKPAQPARKKTGPSRSTGGGKSKPSAARPAKPQPRSDAKSAREVKARLAHAAAEKALAAKRREKVLLTLYERGLKALYARHYQQAMDCFEKVIDEHPGEIELVDRARNFIKICQHEGATRRSPQPKSAEELFDAGVLEHNRSNFQKAIDYFLEAIRLSPKGDYIHYTLAASYSQLGQAEHAVRSLQKAIHLSPESRFHARNDPDFEPIRNRPEFQALVEGSRTE